MRWLLPVMLVAMAGCRNNKFPESEAVWLEGFEFGWAFFNHRLSHLQVQVAESSVTAAIVGGTSTTSVIPEPLDEGCVPDSCDEFPFLDTSDLVVHWGRAVTSEALLLPASIELLASREGVSDTLSVPVDARDDAEVVAVLRGISLDTDQALSGGPACYRPKYGWHPEELAVDLVPTRVGDAVEVEVSVTFAAGDTLDPDRLCIDEVNDQARVPITVDLLVVVGAPAEAKEVHSEATYPFAGDPLDPGEQLPPDPDDLGWTSADALVGWSGFQFRFNPGNPDGRGAYLRTLGLTIDPSGTAVGTATNYSPGTHLWDFEYTFDGTVERVELGEGVTRGSVEANLATVDDDDQPMVHELEY